MYIKEIKINGFKSFADKVNLELNRNFTGIVGPNGSGKSNIVDALKWVMGEQSVKTLRGSNGMTDVIFNGSASREGARSASVTLVLDNTDKTLPLDFSEVEVKRIVYKTGENEYYINKEKVRLKDVNDLFIDSFSSRESLSIIPQGKISEILSGKPEDRRGVLEDAAGVLKYKKRKEETLRKLAKTNENIERVSMIISELETQVGPLKEQSEKALIYKETKDKLESVEVSLIASDIEKISIEVNKLSDEKESLTNSEIKSRTNITKDKVELEKLNLERTNLDNDISGCAKELLVLTDKVNDLIRRKELLEERIKYDKDNDLVKSNVRKLKNEELDMKTNLDSIMLDFESSHNDEVELTKKLDNYNLDYKSLNTKLSVSLNNESNLKKQLLELNNKKDIINYNIENMTKVPYAVKVVLNTPSLKGIKSTIGNIISVSIEYSTMLDVSLGASSNFVITETDRDARNAIEYLKSKNAGRVTFFPMNLIKPKSIDCETLNLVKGMKGYVGIASDLVSYDKMYNNIVTNQLGNIIVVTDIDDALIISKRINARYRVVTLTGEIIHVGGSLTGGSKSKNSVNDKTELDNILKTINTKELDLKNTSDEVEEYTKELEIIKNQIYKTNLDLLKMKEINDIKERQINEFKFKLSKINDEIKALDTKNETNELDILNEEYASSLKEKETILNNQKKLESRRKLLIEEIEEKELLVRNSENKNRKELESINNLEVRITKLNVNLDNLLNRLSEEYNMTYEKARNNYELEMEESVARNIISEYKRTIKSLGVVNLSSIEEYDRIGKRYEFLTNQRDDLKLSEDNLLKIINEMDDVMIEKFATTFKKVNIEFGKVFKNLFGGGNASLELTDPSNMLETGIEIIANPPGKKPGSITLLSGGEKTLTAISLLFAIMNLKNVPFVILDEVESALDEANVDRFGEYIEHYKRKTQLLVITHKKKTMEYVDLLYGITMQESGVSKLVSVKLEDIK